MMYFERGNWLVQFIEEWSQFFHSCNWYTFHPIRLEIEDDRAMGSFEITLVLMGIGARWAWNYTETEKRREIIRQVDEVRRNIGASPE